MGGENFLQQLIENFNEEDSAYVTVADVDEYGNVVYSNSVVENNGELDTEEVTDGTTDGE
jgi:hypothetical protein